MIIAKKVFKVKNSYLESNSFIHDYLKEDHSTPKHIVAQRFADFYIK